jgi:hypothetical protein
MTEQPEVPQDQEQAVPVQPTGMRFFVYLDDLPSASTYMQPLSLFRFEETDNRLIMERFDKKGRKWVDSPSLIAFTGIGGDESYEEVDEEEANRLIAMWTPGEDEVEDADAEPEPEVSQSEKPVGERLEEDRQDKLMKGEPTVRGLLRRIFGV